MSKSPKQYDVEFINYELSKDEKQILKTTVADGMPVLDMLDRLAEEGYRITVKYDDFTSSPACFIQAISDKHPNAGRVLSGRGRTATKAVMEALFKHYHVFTENWPDRRDKSKQDFWDD